MIENHHLFNNFNNSQHSYSIINEQTMFNFSKSKFEDKTITHYFEFISLVMTNSYKIENLNLLIQKEIYHTNCPLKLKKVLKIILHKNINKEGFTQLLSEVHLYIVYFFENSFLRYGW